MEIVEVFGYWKTNLGDDLFLEILCQRYPNTVFRTAIDNVSVKAFSDLDNLIFEVHDSARSAKSAQIARMLFERSLGAKKTSVEIGGSIFIQKNDKRVNAFPYYKRKLVVSCSEAFYFLGCNFGPYYSEHQVNVYHNLFAKINDVCFRDQPSYALFRDLPNVRYAPDIVLGLDPTQVPDQPVFGPEQPYVVVSAIDLDYAERNLGDLDISATKQEYERFLVRNIRAAVAAGRRVVLFSFCDHEQDNLANERLFAALDRREQDQTIQYSHQNTRDSLALLKGAERLIATRFHAMILGWVFQIPTFVVSYSKKTNDIIHTYVPDQRYVDLAEVGQSRELSEADFFTIDDSLRASLKEQAVGQFAALDLRLQPSLVS